MGFDVAAGEVVFGGAGAVPLGEGGDVGDENREKTDEVMEGVLGVGKFVGVRAGGKLLHHLEAGHHAAAHFHGTRVHVAAVGGDDVFQGEIALLRVAGGRHAGKPGLHLKPFRRAGLHVGGAAVGDVEDVWHAAADVAALEV